MKTPPPSQQHLAWMKAYDRARDQGLPTPPELLADPEACALVEAWDRTHQLVRSSLTATAESRQTAATVLEAISRESAPPSRIMWAWSTAAALAASVAIFFSFPRASLPADPALVEHVESAIPGAGAMVLLDHESNTTLVWLVL